MVPEPVGGWFQSLSKDGSRACRRMDPEQPVEGWFLGVVEEPGWK